MSETRATAESIRESARQVRVVYRAGRSLDGDDVGNVAHDLEDAAAEIARLTRELEAEREIIRDLVDDEDAGLVWLGKRLVCAYCDADGLYSVAHADDCPIVRGRRALTTEVAHAD